MFRFFAVVCLLGCFCLFGLVFCFVQGRGGFFVGSLVLLFCGLRGLAVFCLFFLNLHYSIQSIPFDIFSRFLANTFAASEEFLCQCIMPFMSNSLYCH